MFSDSWCFLQLNIFPGQNWAHLARNWAQNGVFCHYINFGSLNSSDIGADCWLTADCQLIADWLLTDWLSIVGLLTDVLLNCSPSGPLLPVSSTSKFCTLTNTNTHTHTRTHTHTHTRTHTHTHMVVIGWHSVVKVHQWSSFGHHLVLICSSKVITRSSKVMKGPHFVAISSSKVVTRLVII